MWTLASPSEGQDKGPLEEEVEWRHLKWSLGKKYFYGHEDVNIVFHVLESIHR